MPSRLTLMMMPAGGLYLGPVLAGLSQQPRWTIAACSAVLVLWSVLYRSTAWPRSFADLAKPRGVATVILVVCGMLVVSSLLYMAGFGLSRIGVAVSLPIAVPLGIPILSLLAAVLVQSPRKAAELDAFLDDALRQLEGFPPGPPASETSAAAQAIATKLAGLSDNATVAEVRAVIGEAALHDAALLGAIDKMGVPPPRPALLAAILIVTDQDGAPGLGSRGEAGWVFDALRGDPELEVLFATRAVALLVQAPDLWQDMPYSYDVEAAAARSRDPKATLLLRELRDRLNGLSRAEEDPGEPGAL